MADMKSLALLPLALLAASCIPPVPYEEQRPPQRNGEPYYPYGPGGQAQGPGTETGTFEPIPPDGSPPPPPRNTGPQAPQIDPYGTTPDSVPVPAPTPRPEYPTARRTDNPNEVISPYAPYNVIDVEGFKSGQLAKDPSNKKIFRVP
jgi:hypothetical protein